MACYPEYKVIRMQQTNNSSLGAPMWRIWYKGVLSGIDYVADTKPNSPACYNASESAMVGKIVSFFFDGSYITHIIYQK